MEIFNDQEKSELEKLTENPVLLSALKKIFLADIYQNGTLSTEPMEEQYMRNYAFSLSFDARTGQEYARSNEDLGKALRAINEALRIVNISFQKIDKYKKVAVDLGVKMPAKHR
jgi:hypothetical protein